MTSRTRPVPAKLGIKALNLKTKWPNVLKVIPSSGAVAAMPEKKTVSSLPTAIENGTRVLIPTHQQQFPGFRGTITIISIKPIDRSKSSIPPILIVPESQQHAPRPISTSLTQQFQQQQPLKSCTSSAAQTAQNRSVLKPVHLHIFLSKLTLTVLGIASSLSGTESTHLSSEPAIQQWSLENATTFEPGLTNRLYRQEVCCFICLLIEYLYI